MCDLGGTINPCEMPLILTITVCIAVAVMVALSTALITTSISFLKSLRS